MELLDLRMSEMFWVLVACLNSLILIGVGADNPLRIASEVCTRDARTRDLSHNCEAVRFNTTQESVLVGGLNRLL